MSATAASLAGPRLDRLSISSFHYRILFLVGAGMFLDAFDVYLQGPVLADLVRTKWSTPSDNATFISATFVGLLIGTLVSGWMGDRAGRRTMYQLNLLIFGLASLAAAFAPSFAFLVGCRLLIGVGLGGEIITGYGALSEFVPAHQRGRWQGALAFVTNLGVPVSAFTSLAVIPNLGWRWMFGIVGVLAVLVWIARKAMPESPRWLESKGRYEEADRVLTRIESEVKKSTGLDLPAVSPTAEAGAAPKAAVKLSALFQGTLLRRTILGTILMVVVNVAVYAFTGWVPTILVSSGIAIASSLLFTSLMQLGTLPGSLLGAWAADRMGRKNGIIWGALLAAVAGFVYGYMRDPVWLTATGFVLVMLLYALVALVVATYLPELFPTSVRLSGSGFCNSVGRVVNIFAPYGVAALLVGLGSTSVFITVGVLLVLASLATAVLGEETKGKSLEVIGEVANSNG